MSNIMDYVQEELRPFILEVNELAKKHNILVLFNCHTKSFYYYINDINSDTHNLNKYERYKQMFGE